jgi:hypothetical protein
MAAIPFRLFRLLLASLKLESPIAAADSHSVTPTVNVTWLSHTREILTPSVSLLIRAVCLFHLHHPLPPAVTLLFL